MGLFIEYAKPNLSLFLRLNGLSNKKPKEYDLLKCFVLNKNVALSREQLITNVWGYDFYGDDRTIDTHVKTLRKIISAFSLSVADFCYEPTDFDKWKASFDVSKSAGSRIPSSMS